MHQCLIVPDWQKTGLARILIARKQPDDKITFGIFLVDIFCMGLKNTFWNANFPAEEYHDSVETKIFQEDVPESCDIGLARKIVYGGIDYARKLGFKPDKDFEMTENILGKPTEADMSIEVNFGKDGKPLYLAGPDDNTARVLKTLRQSVGEGNFDYILDMDKVAEYLGDESTEDSEEE